MEAKSEIRIPQKLKKRATEIAESQARKQEKRIAEAKAAEEKRLEEEPALRLAQQKQWKAKLQYANSIFTWAQKFLNSQDRQDLIQVGCIYGDGICFFDGHIPGVPWRALCIDTKGLYWRSSGCGARALHVHSPEKLAEYVASEILRLASQWIKTGEVWECIERRMEKQQI